jgi:hypothetical protein
MSGSELLRRLAEHHRWNLPVRMVDGKPQPRVFSFEQIKERVLLAFSDTRALALRPAFTRSDKPEDQMVLTVPGALVFQLVPDENVDLLVLDPVDDLNAPTTINYRREQHPMLKRVGHEVSLELAATDWSHLNPGTLREGQFWILVSGGQVHNLLAPDGYRRPRLALFTSEAALDAHLQYATPEQQSAFAQAQRLLAPGHTLFPQMAKLDVAGIVINPSGPGRSRAFNKRTLEVLASDDLPNVQK